jgi:hypothetical protein
VIRFDFLATLEDVAAAGGAGIDRLGLGRLQFDPLE